MCYNVDDKIRKTFSNFYHRYSELIVKYNIGPIFYGDLVHKFERIVGKPYFSDQFKKIIKRDKKLGLTWI